MDEVYLKFEKDFDLQKKYKWKNMNKYLSAVDPELDKPTYNSLDDFF